MSSLELRDKVAIGTFVGLTALVGARGPRAISASELNQAQSSDCRITYKIPTPTEAERSEGRLIGYHIRDAITGKTYPIDIENPALKNDPRTREARLAVTVNAAPVGNNQGQNEITGYREPDFVPNVGPVPCGSEVIVTSKFVDLQAKKQESNNLKNIAIVGGLIAAGLAIKALIARKRRTPTEEEIQRQEAQAEHPARNDSWYVPYMPWWWSRREEHAEVQAPIVDEPQDTVTDDPADATVLDTIGHRQMSPVEDEQEGEQDNYQESTWELFQGIQHQNPPEDTDQS